VAGRLRRPEFYMNALIVENYSSGASNVVLDTDGYFEP
jgi:hypothetical protein